MIPAEVAAEMLQLCFAILEKFKKVGPQLGAAAHHGEQERA